MATCLLPTVQTIHDMFVTEIRQLDGCVMDEYRDEEFLLLRSVLPHTECVRPTDVVQGGVALRATEQEIFVHPYTLRKVCQNGAIMAVVTDSRHMVRVDSEGPQEQVDAILEDLCAAVRACGQKAMLRDTVHAMQQASNLVLDQHISASLLSMLPSAKLLGRRFFRSIIQRFAGGRDRTLFGLMNAVTSLARDTRDPETRWRLEELGGGVPALVCPTQKPGDAFAVPLGDLPFATCDEYEWSADMQEEITNVAEQVLQRTRRHGQTAGAK